MRRPPETEFIPGNRCTLLRDGEETFPAQLEAIGAARRFVHLEVFRFRDDSLGRAFESALVERAKCGVDVRVLVDGFGSMTTPWSFFARLLRAGGRVAVFRPVAPWRRGWGFYRRDHRKILVVDGTVGFAGGLNVDLCHSSRARGGGGWRDTHLRVAGPAVRELGRAFWDTWLASAAPEDCPADLTPWDVSVEPAGTHSVQIVASHVRHTRGRIRRAYLAALAAAKRSAWLTNPYFLPDARFARAMTDAAARGVDVRLLVPARSDVSMADLASMPLLRAVAKRGIRVFQRMGSVLHAKTAVVDGTWSTVGSCNIDPLSLQNLELNVNVRDADVGAELGGMFMEDLRSAKELVPSPAAAHVRFAEWTLHGLRHWM